MPDSHRLPLAARLSVSARAYPWARLDGSWPRPASTLWLPVVLWAALIFALSSIPDLGTGLGTWDSCCGSSPTQRSTRVLGALLFRALRREPLAILLGSAYAVTDEVHQALRLGATRLARSTG